MASCGADVFFRNSRKSGRLDYNRFRSARMRQRCCTQAIPLRSQPIAQADGAWASSLIVPTAEDWQAAWLAYERGEADSAGIVDQVSFTIMRRLGISKAFTNDGHFRAAGFETLF